MKEQKEPYSAPQLHVTAFEAKDVLLLSEGSDENEGAWKPLSDTLRLEIFGDMQL